jgi:hypothetical protein
MTTQRGHRQLPTDGRSSRASSLSRSTWPLLTTYHDDDQVDPSAGPARPAPASGAGSNLGQTTHRRGHGGRPRRPGHPSRAAASPAPRPATSFPSDTADAATHGRRRPDTGHLTLRHPHRTPVTGQSPWDTGHLTPDAGHRMPDTNPDTVTTAQPASGPAWPPGSDRTLRRPTVLCSRTASRLLGFAAGQAAPRRTALLGSDGWRVDRDGGGHPLWRVLRSVVWSGRSSGWIWGGVWEQVGRHAGRHRRRCLPRRQDAPSEQRGPVVAAERQRRPKVGRV